MNIDSLTTLIFETEKIGVDAMALLDKANTESYGNPEITKVNLTVGKNPRILISEHDLRDLEELLEQTEGTGIDVYTHGEMLLALLHLGVKNIHFGPTLPAFLSPNVAKVLVENFGIGTISTVQDDIKNLIG